MGSSLSLFNNTSDTFLVKIIPTTWNFASVDAITAAVVTQFNGLNRPVPQLGLTRITAQSSPSHTVFEMSGITPANLSRLLSIANSNAGADAQGWASSLSTIISNHILHEEGCELVRSGRQSSRHEGTLSLVRRGVCYRVMPNPKNREQVSVDLVIMHPIFTGPTNNSNNIYHMQPWINENGLNFTQIIRLDAASQAAIRAATGGRGTDVSTAPAPFEFGWLQAFTEARLEAKKKILQEEGKDCDVGIVEEAPSATNQE